MAQHHGASRAGGSKQSTEESVDEMEGDEHEMNGGDGYGYGSTPGTPMAMAMDAPVRALKDKWRLLPHFLAMRGLMKQHIGELRASRHHHHRHRHHRHRRRHRRRQPHHHPRYGSSPIAVDRAA